MDYSAQPEKNKSEDRLDVFASVQFDPEVWELVQKKYNHFEDLHHQLEDLQGRRRHLLSQLSEVNASISNLQDQIVTLSGKEVEDTQAAEAVEVVEAAAQQPEITKPEEEAEPEPVVGLAPLETEANEAEDEPAQESTVAWPGVDAPAAEAAPEPEDTTLAESTEAYQSVVAEPEPAAAESTIAEPIAPPVMPAQVSFAQPIKEKEAEPEPAAPIEAAAPISVEPVAVPSEVQELQQLFDAANDQQRQTDSALKLVQLYDGKADVFFSAMCRSHQQSGLNETEARQEATKDVQTMIATAKSHSANSSVETKKNQNGGMRRLFSH